jgi:uncharacterized protein (UPF0332 family)
VTAFEWEALLRLAERMLEAAPDDESTQRTAINRAYYALFNVAKGPLLAEGVAIPSMGVAHEIVWQAYHAAGRGPRRKIAQIGFRLLRLRGRADYESEYPDAASDSVFAVRRSKEGIESIRRIGEHAGAGLK